MNASEANALMHAVLDGEATRSETAVLERELAEHPELNARFATLRNLFEDLRQVPMGYPPEGLVASVMANIPQNRSESDDERQLFTVPGVLGASSQVPRGRRRDESRAGRIEVQPWLRRKGKDMSDKNQGFPSKRKWWIGGGIAAAVVVIGLASGVIPPNGKDTAGTIVPAQRYQAAQSGVQDVQGGGVGDGTSQTSAAVGQPVDATANAGALNSGDRGGLSSGDRGGLNSGNRGGLNAGDRGGLN
ncbi:MAG: anti-sigma factor family protein, partial [Casimicrobiaceae bacterium]